MMPGARLRPELQAFKAYQAEPLGGEDGLDANENPYAPPAAWLERAHAALDAAALNRYPDPRAAGLRDRLARRHGIPAQSLLLANGSDEILPLLLTAFGGAEAACLVPEPTFSMYALCARAQGWKVLAEPLGRDWELTPAFLERARRERPSLVFLASPNNPTGNAFDGAAVDALLKVPGLTVVLDEAYAEFAGAGRVAEAPEREGLLVLRTFSKAWGLAGLRLGWLAGAPATVAELEKVRLPYNTGALTQALAEAALDLAPAFEARVEEIKAGREGLRRGLAGLPGLAVYPSQANFLLLRTGDAAGLHAAWLKAGLRTRRFQGTPALEGCLRVSVGTPGQNERLVGTARRFLGGKA